MSTQSKKREIEKLYRDAFEHHLSKEEISEYLKEVDMRRRKARYYEF